MLQEALISKIKVVEKIASASKVRRMLRHPAKYIHAILFRELIYKRTKKEKEVVCSTFFDAPMHLLLPSSTDIYLTGGKSHPSEIRLAKFLIHHLHIGDTFIDVGAHYGYFSLLASKLVGDTGSVFAFEASPTTYEVLEKNKSNFENILVYHRAVSDEDTHLIFYEFPNLYSEYNTLDITQFKDEDWFAAYTPKSIKVKSIIPDAFLKAQKINPKVIKIDVEGAEYKVINGLKEFLTDNSPVIVMEYLSDERGNEAHIKAEKLLKSLGFQSFIIDDHGEPQAIASISNYLTLNSLESDNIVFMR